MYILIQEGPNALDVLYPCEDEVLKISFEGDYACISFTDEETGHPVTAQIHKGTILSTAKKIQEDLLAQVRAR